MDVRFLFDYFDVRIRSLFFLLRLEGNPESATYSYSKQWQLTVSAFFFPFVTAFFTGGFLTGTFLATTFFPFFGGSEAAVAIESSESACSSSSSSESLFPFSFLSGYDRLSASDSNQQK